VDDHDHEHVAAAEQPVMTNDEDDKAADGNGKSAAESSGSDDDDEGEEYVAMIGDESGDRDTNGGTKTDEQALDSEPRKEETTEKGSKREREDKESQDADGSEGGDDGNNATGEKKRRHVPLTQKKQEQLDFAKTKLSKWAARLFDPNRPRGLVETPQTIPLNDEFLTAFGKREKDFAGKIGREIDIDKASLDAQVEEEDNSKSDNVEEKKRNVVDVEKCKIKIINLAYLTTTKTITRACGKVGPVLDVNLITDPDTGQSLGRAFVVFESPETAAEAVEYINEKSLEGRVLRATLSTRVPGKKRTSFGGGLTGGIKKKARYWEKDISLKCRRCDEVGHTDVNCPNEEKPRPCALCAELGHDGWKCPKKAVCFNCGVPGHVSRNCHWPRNMAKRVVCTICYESGHHRWNCRDQPWDETMRDAICMDCGKVGHFMCCSEMRWFFGLKGNSCFQCGGQGHHGSECKRPSLDVCARNNEVANREIEMAEALSLSEDLSNQQKKSTQDSRGRSREDYGRERARARSQPPPRDQGYSYNDRGNYDDRRPSYSQEPRSFDKGQSDRRNSGYQPPSRRRGYR